MTKRELRKWKEAMRRRGRTHGASCGICAKPHRYRKDQLTKEGLRRWEDVKKELGL